MNLRESILYILNNDVKPAVGCTEPVAIALACATAKSVLEGEIDKVVVKLSPNVYKNGMNVGIPGIDEIGLDVAAALGTAKGDPSEKLKILGNIDVNIKNHAKELLKEKRVEVKLLDTSKKIYIECSIHAGNDISKAIIEDRHDNITNIFLNNNCVFSAQNNDTLAKIDELDDSFFEYSITDIIKEIEKLDFEDIKYMLEGISMNEEAAALGMSKKFGIGVGYAIKENIEKGLIAQDLPDLAMMMTAAASDARMSGFPIPVMSSNGSGNHGLTAILPIVAYNKMYPTDDDKIARALAISHLVTAYIKHYVGRLSCLCGCSIAAGTGSACAVVWLMGGEYTHIQGVIKNILANQSGVVCDGAKPGCSLKLGTAAASAMQSAILAINGFSASKNNGIVTKTAEQSIKNLGILSQKGMNDVDKTIIDIMLEENILAC